MAVPSHSYPRVIAHWGADATSGHVWPPFVYPWQLAGPGDDITGTGVSGTDWAVVSTSCEVLRQGGYNFASGWSLTHYFTVSARLRIGNGILRFRLQDVTNSNTLASWNYPAGVTYAYEWNEQTTTFADIPTGDARVQLQYSMDTGETAEFRFATWQVINDRRTA